MKNKLKLLILSSVVLMAVACGNGASSGITSTTENVNQVTTTEQATTQAQNTTIQQPGDQPSGEFPSAPNGDNPGDTGDSGDSNDNPGGQQNPDPNQGGQQNPGGSMDITGGTENDVNFTEYSTLPVINVTTDIDGTTGEHKAINSLETYTGCTIDVTNCDEEFALAAKNAGIRLRGNSTSQFVKKPYRIKFEKAQSMLGLNESQKYKSWVLLADWNDYSYSRNYFSLHLGNKMKYMEFAGDSKHVEVFIDGKYKGIYLLTEQMQVNPGRVDVDMDGEDNPDLEDTGYLLELEASTTRRANEGVEGEAWFRLDDYAVNKTIGDMDKTADNTFAYYVIKSDARSEKQVAFIKNYMTQVYNAIYKTKDRDTIENLIDVNTAIDMYIMQILANDGDGNFSSIYCYKDKGGKLKFGPPWDFDNSYMGSTSSSAQTFYHLLSDLYKNYSWFASQVKERLVEYYAKDGIINAALAEAKNDITVNADCFNNREYVKWRDGGSSQGGFTTQYTSVGSAFTSFESWLAQHKTWVASTYGVTLD